MIQVTDKEGEELAALCEQVLEDNVYDWQLSEKDHTDGIDGWAKLINKLDPSIDPNKIRKEYKWYDSGI